MRAYLFYSKKVLSVEIKYGWPEFPEEQLVVVVLVNGITECLMNQAAGSITWVTAFHPQNSVQGLWQMRNEPLVGRETRLEPGSLCLQIPHRSHPRLVPCEQIQFIKVICQVCVCVHALEGIKGEVCQEGATRFVRVDPVLETAKADAGTATTVL